MTDDLPSDPWHPHLTELISLAFSDLRALRVFITSHPDALHLRTGLGETALHYLAVENRSEAVQLLIDLGADVNVRNDFGASAIQEAKELKAWPTVQVLRRAGADESS